MSKHILWEILGISWVVIILSQIALHLACKEIKKLKAKLESTIKKLTKER